MQCVVLVNSEVRSTSVVVVALVELLLSCVLTLLLHCGHDGRLASITELLSRFREISSASDEMMGVDWTFSFHLFWC